MNCIRCLIVDDEPLARQIIEKYLSKLPEFKIVAGCATAVEAFQILTSQTVDLVFLDIEMPELSGIVFLKNVNNLPPVILTTAHREFALEGYELNVVDYLLKPIRFERFLQAVEKFQSKRLSPKIIDLPKEKSGHAEFINIKADRKIYKVNLDEILYIESDRDYIKVTTAEKCIMSKQTISSIEKELPSDRFMRIHRSTIVAISKIDSFDTTMIEIGKRQFPIGRNYKNTVMEKLA